MPETNATKYNACKLSVNEIVDGVSGILLAAGQSERFEGHKGLAQLPDGIPMALRSAMNLRATLMNVICVVRPGDQVLHDLFDEHGFHVVVAGDAALGMSASLQAGICSTPDAVGWMIALADMPLIKPDTYRQLMTAFLVGQQIILPRSESKAPTGHPVIFPSRFKSDLLALRGDKGAKSVLRQYPDDIQQVWVDDPGILQDFDTRQAFNRLFI